MICDQCKKLGEKSAESFSKLERVFLLSAVASMMKWIMANPNAAQNDKIVGSSVTTKLLLSFPEDQRDTMIRGLQASAGVDIQMKGCHHNEIY